MTTFKAMATNKETGEKVIITSDYPTKSAFIKDLRANGFSVTTFKVKEASEWDRIVNETQAQKSDWLKK